LTDDRWLIREQERKRKDNPMHERERGENVDTRERKTVHASDRRRTGSEKEGKEEKT